MRLWETQTGRLVMSAKDETNSVLGIAFTRDGQMLTSGSLDGIIRLLEAPSGRLLATLAGRSSTVWCVSFSVDVRLLAGGSQDGSVLLWEISSPAMWRLWRGTPVRSTRWRFPPTDNFWLAAVSTGQSGCGMCRVDNS